CMQGLEFPHTF
nr:immunoglobulin light chain junction region [Macaca mulatta]MOW39507.1 immunoglobulin light chain junction region [Macaca mulatta]MOW39881.1 immunoglobulin light chain junction region [Macaca mulatta]MOX86092.1 immunoglobulin light chain junction region [Macaca mulatta]MOX89183.1 immunoglobulin light chain junction region [Macaca mulatta]